MSNNILRFHLVDGKITATFSHSLSGRQFAHLYKAVRSPITKAQCGKELISAARDWGFRVELDPTPGELGISPDPPQLTTKSLPGASSLPFPARDTPACSKKLEERQRVLPLNAWLGQLRPAPAQG